MLDLSCLEQSIKAHLLLPPLWLCFVIFLTSCPFLRHQWTNLAIMTAACTVGVTLWLASRHCFSLQQTYLPPLPAFLMRNHFYWKLSLITSQMSLS